MKVPISTHLPSPGFSIFNLCQTKRFTKKKKLSLFHLTVFSSWRWRRQWHPTPVLLPGESHGWRRLVGCSPGVTKSQTQLSDFTFTFHFHALEKEMAPQYSCLENPRDGGAWWAIIYGVTQSRTWLKRLSRAATAVGEVENFFMCFFCDLPVFLMYFLVF